MSFVVLEESAWRARRAAHETRVDALVAPHLARRSAGTKHPVHDFLFTYYSHRPAQLRRWHPGYGVGLVGGELSDLGKGYERVVCLTTTQRSVSGMVPEEARDEPSRRARPDAMTVSDAYVASQQPWVESIHALLIATAVRPANFGCFGMHEWAMVHGQAETRHGWPLRLGRAGTDEVVESHRISCSHFDAFRFFTPSAQPLNVLSPSAHDRPDFEQPACLHAGMDLYKHAFRLSPMVPSELVSDCFELARDIRVLDMRAAPYDLTDLGFEPVRIETAEGKQEYAAGQRALARRGAPLRRRLTEECARLLAARSTVAPWTTRADEYSPTF